MMPPEDASRGSSQSKLGSTAKKVAVVYVVLACFGLGVVLSFIPGAAEIGQLTSLQWLTLLAVGLFVIGPVAAVAYILASVVVEGAVYAIELAIATGFAALVSFVKRKLGATKGD